MGNSITRCACCDQKNYRFPFVFDHFNIIERLPRRTIVRMQRYQRQDDEEDQKSSESEKEKEDKEKQEGRKKNQSWYWGFMGTTKGQTSKEEKTPKQISNPTPKEGYIPFEDEENGDVDEFSQSSDEQAEPQYDGYNGYGGGPVFTPDSKTFTAAKNDPPSNNQNPPGPSIDSNGAILFTVAKNHQTSTSHQEPSNDISKVTPSDISGKYSVPKIQGHLLSAESKQETPSQGNQETEKTDTQIVYHPESQPFGDPIMEEQSNTQDDHNVIVVGTLGPVTNSNRTDFTITGTGTGKSSITDNLSRATGTLEEAKNYSESEASSECYLPKTQEQLQDEINWLLGPIQKQIQKLQAVAKKKTTSKLEKELNTKLCRFKITGLQLMLDKIQMVHSEEYLDHKQALLDELARETEQRRRQARIETYEFLQIMTEAELNVTLLALLPFVKIEERPSPDKCKYMIGTQSGMLLIKSNTIMIRVGGGFATLDAHIKQVGPFECIKIYKTMKNGDEKTGEPGMSFHDTVVFYLKRLQAPDRIIKQFQAADEDDDQLELFEYSMEYLQQKQVENAQNFAQASAERRTSIRGGNSPRNAQGGKNSPRGGGQSPRVGAPSPRNSALSPRAGGFSPRGTAAATRTNRFY